MIRVLICDDSAFMRALIRAGLEGDSRFHVVAEAADANEARAKIRALDPHVLTLDVEMPGLNGLDFLQRLMRLRPLPVVMVSTLTARGADATLQALALGAVDVIEKPSATTLDAVSRFGAQLRAKVRAAAGAKIGVRASSPHSPAPMQFSPSAFIAFGASTGGVEALHALAAQLPQACPPIAIVQHLPPGYAERLAQRLSEMSAIAFRQAQDGEQIAAGEAVIAPAGAHLRIRRSGGAFFCERSEEAPCAGHKPSVDVLMRSVALAARTHAIGVLLTGMGADGADGLAAMRQNGAHTIAESEQTAVVFGMPKAAIERGGACEISRLSEIPAAIRGALQRSLQNVKREGDAEGLGFNCPAG